MSMPCHFCGAVILLPTGDADESAKAGDLCDKCMEIERDHAQSMQEWREELKLDQQLRRRP